MSSLQRNILAVQLPGKLADMVIDLQNENKILSEKLDRANIEIDNYANDYNTLHQSIHQLYLTYPIKVRNND